MLKVVRLEPGRPSALYLVQYDRIRLGKRSMCVIIAEIRRDVEKLKARVSFMHEAQN